jgi:hypothetical protein
VGVGGMRICWKGRGYAGRVEDMLEGSVSSLLKHPRDPGRRGLRLRRLHRAQAGRHRHAHMEKTSPTAPCLLHDTATSAYHVRWVAPAIVREGFWGGNITILL